MSKSVRFVVRDICVEIDRSHQDLVGSDQHATAGKSLAGYYRQGLMLIQERREDAHIERVLA